MSSLGTSVVLLVILAVVLVMLYNLRQSWPRLRLREGWWRIGRAGVPASAGAPGGAHRPRREPPDPAGAPGPAPRARGEPRLGTGAAHPGPDASRVPGGAAAPRSAPAAAAPPGPAALPEEPAAHAPADTSAPAHTPAMSAPPGPAQPGTAAGTAPAVSAPREGAGAAAAPLLSEVADCIVTLALPAPCPGERVLPIVQRFRRAGGKPVAIEGRAGGAGPGEWGVPAAGASYEALRIGVLMANRHGPLNAMEYSEFVAGVQAIAESLSALADTPDMATVLARARDLDATCAQLDAQIGVNVQAPDPLGPAQLAGLAGALSVVERGSNRYARIGAQGELMFSVALDDAPARLTFLLDVPRCPPALDAWGHMTGAARECAAQLRGRLVDDKGQPLAEATLAQIGRQLLQRYESLEAIGLPAGSPLALKVFN